MLSIFSTNFESDKRFTLLYKISRNKYSMLRENFIFKSYFYFPTFPCTNTLLCFLDIRSSKWKNVSICLIKFLPLLTDIYTLLYSMYTLLHCIHYYTIHLHRLYHTIDLNSRVSNRLIYTFFLSSRNINHKDI